jgi:hypothetical protein
MNRLGRSTLRSSRLLLVLTVVPATTRLAGVIVAFAHYLSHLHGMIESGLLLQRILACMTG